MEAVEALIGALESASSRGVAAYCDELGTEDLGVGFDLGVLKPVESEYRLEHDDLAIRERVGVRGFGRSQRSDVERPVGLEDLGVPHRDPVAGFAPDCESDKPGDVLVPDETHVTIGLVGQSNRQDGDRSHRRRNTGLDQGRIE